MQIRLRDDLVDRATLRGRTLEVDTSCLAVNQFTTVPAGGDDPLVIYDSEVAEVIGDWRPGHGWCINCTAMVVMQEHPRCEKCGSSMIEELAPGKPLRMAFYGIFRVGYGFSAGVDDGWGWGFGCGFHEPELTAQVMKGFQMRVSGIAFVDRSDDPEDQIVVDVIPVDPSQVYHSVDVTEGHPHQYCRTWVPDRLGGVWIYLRASHAPVVVGGDWLKRQKTRRITRRQAPPPA